MTTLPPLRIRIDCTDLCFSSTVGGIIAVYAFLAKDAPRYTPGYSICIAFICLSLIANCVYLAAIKFENRKRDRLQAQGGSSLSPDERKRLGDLNPDYRYFT